MTPEQINRAIAEHCGWTFLPERNTRLGPQPEMWEGPDGDRYFESPLKDWPPYPNYYEDHDTTYEAFLTLDANQRDEFIKALYAIMDKACDEMLSEFLGGPEVTAYLWAATAAQRAEAFLRTINKWKDE